MAGDAEPPVVEWGDNALALRPTVLVAPRLTPEVFASAGLVDADALALADSDDVANVNAALIAREVNPSVRIVVRVFNQVLGEGVATMLGDCEMLSGSEIAAPAFVAAVLGDDRPAYVRLPDGYLTAVARGRRRRGARQRRPRRELIRYTPALVVPFSVVMRLGLCHAVAADHPSAGRAAVGGRRDRCAAIPP